MLMQFLSPGPLQFDASEACNSNSQACAAETLRDTLYCRLNEGHTLTGKDEGRASRTKDPYVRSNDIVTGHYSADSRML